MATAESFVNKARSYVGVKESPAGSNLNQFGKKYGMDGEPWCDIFVSVVGDEVGARGKVGWFAYCPDHVNWFKERGQWLDREEKPQPGDIIFFGNKGTACHVGIVTQRNGSNSVSTIEGNTSVSSDDNGGAVMERERTYGSVGSSWYIMGFGRPDWDSVNSGWVKDDKGWWYRNADGTWPKSKWMKIGGKWFYFGPDGYMYEKRWLKDGGKWYYLKEGGYMAEGECLNLDGKWFAFASEAKKGVTTGAMYEGSAPIASYGNLDL